MITADCFVTIGDAAAAARRGGSTIVVPDEGNPFAVAIIALFCTSRPIAFWLLTLGFGIDGRSTNGLINTNRIAYCGNHGFTEVSGVNSETATWSPRTARLSCQFREPNKRGTTRPSSYPECQDNG
jgi:hypothetical protein